MRAGAGNCSSARARLTDPEKSKLGGAPESPGSRQYVTAPGARLDFERRQPRPARRQARLGLQRLRPIRGEGVRGAGAARRAAGEGEDGEKSGDHGFYLGTAAASRHQISRERRRRLRAFLFHGARDARTMRVCVAHRDP